MRWLLALAVLGVSCGDDMRGPAPPPPPSSTLPTLSAHRVLTLSAHRVQQLSDAEIAGVMITANSGEIEQAKLARDRAQDSRVREFAKTMFDDHTAALDRMNHLASQLNLDPATPSQLRAQLGSEAAGQLIRLALVAGADFDRTYLELSVLDHSQLLNLLDTQLIPSSKDPALRSELEMTRSLVARHLAAAKELLGHL